MDTIIYNVAFEKIAEQYKEAISFRDLSRVAKLKTGRYRYVRPTRSVTKNKFKGMLTPISFPKENIQMQHGTRKIPEALMKASRESTRQALLKHGVPPDKITAELIDTAQQSSMNHIHKVLTAAGVDLSRGAPSQLIMPRKFHKPLQKHLASSGIKVKLPQTPQGQRGLNDMIAIHEANELALAGKSLALGGRKNRAIASHVDFKVIADELNQAYTLPGSPGRRLANMMHSVRKPELLGVRKHLQDPKAIAAIDKLLAKQRINRHGIKRIRRDYFKHGKQVMPAQ